MNLLSYLIKKTPDFDYSSFPSVAGYRQSLSRLLSRHPTPFFVSDASIINNRIDRLSAALTACWNGKQAIAYSFKTNYDVAQNINFPLAEVVSQHELTKALSFGYKYNSIIFNGPNKGNLDNLLTKPIIINIDNFSELIGLTQSKTAVKARIGLRVNTHNHPSRFGFNLESGELLKAITILRQAGKPLSGLHLHLGSDIQTAQIYSQSAAAVSRYIRNHPDLFTGLEYLDFGGGFPSHGLLPGRQIQSNPDIDNFIVAVCKPLAPAFPARKPLLIFEPGRYLVDDSTFMISRILDVKQFNQTSQSVTVDTANTILPSVWYRQPLLRAFDSSLHLVKSPLIDTLVYGSSCQETDQLFRGQLPPLSPGSYIVFFCVGAYNQSQASDFIFPRPVTYFIKK